MGFFPFTSVPDSEYLLDRSTAEAAMAASARTERAAAHHRMASCYLAKLFGGRSAASPAAGPAGSRVATTGDGAIGPSGLRFVDLTSVPHSDELTRILHDLG